MYNMVALVGNEETHWLLYCQMWIRFRSEFIENARSNGGRNAEMKEKWS